MFNNTTKSIKKSVLYVNFSPYVNAGNILDYLLSTFPLVVVFCFNFYKLGAEQEPSRITIYQHKKIIYNFPLYQTPTPASFVFILLPLRSVILFIQLFFHTWRLSRIYGAFDYFFTVNAFVAWCGNILRTFRVVQKTIFWVWDYYPPQHSDPFVRLMRQLYWQFDKPATLQTNQVIFLNNRLGDLRKDIGILPKKSTITSIGIATNPRNIIEKSIKKEIRLVFFGVIKKSHGLDLIFTAANTLRNAFPNISLDVIGGGPDEQYYVSLAKSIRMPINFHGFINSEDRVDKLIQHCHIGLAPYTNDESNVSQYTDPSKIKRYLSNGLPVITTDVFEFSDTLEEEKAGVIITYTSDSVVKAVKKIVNDYQNYQKNSVILSKKYSYRTLYKDLFN